MSHDRTEKLVVCRLVSSAQETQRHNSENQQNRTLGPRKGSWQAEIKSTNSRLIMTEEVFKNWMKRSSRSKKNFIVLKQKHDVNILHEQLLKQKWDLREVQSQSLIEMEELTKVSEFHFSTLQDEDKSRIRIPSLNSQARYRNYRNEINCINDSRDGPPSIWDTHASSGNVFVNPAASSSAPYPQKLNSWSLGRAEPIHSSQQRRRLRIGHQFKIKGSSLSGPSAKNPVIFSGGDSSKNCGADQQRLQISDLHFDKFPTPATFACEKVRLKTEVCICSQFPTEAMHWIKVELVDSVDDLRSSSSTRGISMPNFEVLDARIASALNNIIHNSHFKRRICLEEHKAQKSGLLPSRKTDCSPGHKSQRFCG